MKLGTYWSSQSDAWIFQVDGNDLEMPDQEPLASEVVRRFNGHGDMVSLIRGVSVGLQESGYTALSAYLDAELEKITKR